MKMLQIIDSGGLYGAEVMLLSLMQELQQIGVDTVLASIGDPGVPEKPVEQEARLRGLRMQQFRFRPGPNLSGAFELLRYARQEGVDLLHSHGYKGNILLGLLPRFLQPSPMVSTLHGWTWTAGFNRMLLYERFDALALRRVDQVVLVNETLKTHPRLQGGIQKRIRVIENGVSCGKEVQSVNRSVLDQTIVDFCSKGITIGAVGRLSPEKGFDLLIDALASLVSRGRDLRLVILGEGALRSALEDQILRLGLQDRVLMPGYRDHGDTYLTQFQIFAMPSLTEGLPMVMLEAMRAGVPIVASAVGGIPRLLDAGKAGRLVPTANLQALEQALEDLLDHPKQALERAELASQRLVEHYSSQAMAKKYLDTYQEVLHNHAG